MNITPEELPEFIRKTLVGIMNGRALACKDGVDTQFPDEVTFTIPMAFTRNSIIRTQVVDPNTTVTTQVQTKDTVTTHGRTNEEDRLNRGDKVTTAVVTQESSSDQ